MAWLSSGAEGAGLLLNRQFVTALVRFPSIALHIV
eukprot:COSAG02_NODE_10444_length_1939_cov_6.518155_4_plen_34_part_01